MIKTNKKKIFLLFGLITCVEESYASKDKSSVGKDLMALEEKEGTKLPTKFLSKDEEKKSSDELLRKINNLSKKNPKGQEIAKVSSIAVSAYNNDRYYINKEGIAVLIE